MTGKRSPVLAVLCALAVGIAACGGDDDNGDLSYEATGTELSRICDRLDPVTDELTGEPENDAPLLEDNVIPEFERAIEDVRELDVHEDLRSDRDAFVRNGEEQLEIVRDAQSAADTGDADAYHGELGRLVDLDRESDEIASRLGASGCIGD